MTDGDETRPVGPEGSGEDRAGSSWKNVDHHAQRDAWSDRFASGGPADFLYGAIVAGFMLAVSSTHDASSEFVVLAVAGVLIRSEERRVGKECPV